MLSRKSEAVNQVTFDEDYNVPDTKPDVGRMIQKKGEVVIEDVEVSEGQANIRGNLKFYLLYVGEGDDNRVYSLTGNWPSMRSCICRDWKAAIKSVSNGRLKI